MHLFNALGSGSFKKYIKMSHSALFRTFLLAKEVVTLSPSQNFSALSGFRQLAQKTLFIDLYWFISVSQEPYNLQNLKILFKKIKNLFLKCDDPVVLDFSFFVFQGSSAECSSLFQLF